MPQAKAAKEKRCSEYVATGFRHERIFFEISMGRWEGMSLDGVSRRSTAVLTDGGIEKKRRGVAYAR